MRLVPTARTLLLILGVLALGRSASARETHPAALPGWVVDRWTVQDGLPLTHVEDVTESEDGFIWLGTFDGVVRFDGAEMRVFRRSTDPALPTNRLYDVEIGPDGALWVAGEPDRVIEYREGRFRSWQLPRTAPAVALTLESAGGQIWAVDEDISALGATGPVSRSIGVQNGSKALTSDDSGNVWVNPRRDAVFRIGRGGTVSRFELVLPSTEAPYGSIAAGPGDRLWVATVRGLYQATLTAGGQLEAVVAQGPAELGQEAFCAVTRTPDGGLVARSESRWWRYDGRRFEAKTSGAAVARLHCAGHHYAWRNGELWELNDGTLWRGDRVIHAGLPAVRKLFVDSRGDVWLGTVGQGLLRVRPVPIRTSRISEVPGADNIESVVADRDGTVLVSLGREGLFRIRGTDKLKISVPPLTDASGVSTQHTYAPIPTTLGTIVPLTDGRCLLREDACTTLPHPALTPGHAVGCQLGDGPIWFSGAVSGLGILEPGPEGGVHTVLRRTESLRAGIVRSMACLADGSVLVGTIDRGLLHVSQAETRTYDRASGLGSDAIRFIHIDRSSVAWFGTDDAGLCRLPVAAETAGVARCLGRREGLADDTVNGIAEDGAGRVWVAHNRGITIFDRRSLELGFDAGRAPLGITLTDRDGMTSAETNGFLQPAVARGGDGRFYFATQSGVAVVEPESVPNPSPPPLRFESLVVGGAARALPPPGEPLVLNSHERDLAITWAATEFGRPHDVRFRYRLVGVQDEWSEPLTRLGASWTNLPPGIHSLEVQAGAMTWGEPITLRLERLPAFTETRFFLFTIGLMGTAVAGVLFAFRARRLVRRRRELEGLVAIRTAELHARGDTLERQARELKLQARRLQELDDLKTRFVANVSHELRTPMALVAGPLEDLADDLQRSAPDLAARLGVIRRNSDRLQCLIDQLLDIARLDSGGLPLRARRADFRAFLHRVVERFQLAGTGVGARVTVAADSPSIEAYFDADLLDKVVTNLVANALKFSPDGGRVMVRLRGPQSGQSRDALRVSVADEGVGIPESELPRLFDRFYQVERQDDRRFEGAGIGLSLVRELVQLHGGEVGVESRVGLGSTFWFTIPLGAVHLEPHEIDLTGPAGPDDAIPGVEEGDEKPALLVVEDNPDMRAYLVEHLGALGRVAQAADGAHGLAATRRLRPQVVISDVMMPGMDGIAMSQAIRADSELSATRIVLVSAKAGPEDAAAGLQVADDYVTKPFRMRELVLRVQKLMALPPGASLERSDGSSVVGQDAPGEAVPVMESPGAGAGLLVPEVDRVFAERARAAVVAHLDDGEFGVAELAKLMALSPRQLQRRCREVTGQGPLELIRAVRMDEARALLIRGAYQTVAEVAARVWMSPSYFSRFYSSWFGCPPSDDLATRSV